MTGGRAVEYREIDAAALRKILESVKNDGLSQYVVGFVPPSASGKPGEHKLEIKLAPIERSVRRRQKKGGLLSGASSPTRTDLAFEGRIENHKSASYPEGTYPRMLRY